MLSVKGESANELTELFLIGTDIPGILQIRSSVSLSQRCSSASCIFDGGGTLMMFTRTMSLEVRIIFTGNTTGSSWLWLIRLLIGVLPVSLV